MKNYPGAVKVRKAVKDDCRKIAELALMAGEGIPAFFWERSKQHKDEDIIVVGARAASSEHENFSYRNMWLAISNDEVAGMLLAYRLPMAESVMLEEYPEFIRPLVELERCVPGSFYINMLATYPDFRNQGIGTALMGIVDSLAQAAQCTETSIQVFGQNAGAVRLYRRLGYRVVGRRPVVKHPCHSYEGEVLLLTRAVSR